MSKNVKIEDNVHAKLKEYCLNDGRIIKTLVSKLIEEFLIKEKRKGELNGQAKTTDKDIS